MRTHRDAAQLDVLERPAVDIVDSRIQTQRFGDDLLKIDQPRETLAGRLAPAEHFDQLFLFVGEVGLEQCVARHLQRQAAHLAARQS